MQPNVASAYYHPYAMLRSPATSLSPAYRPTTSVASYGAFRPARVSDDVSSVLAIDQQLEKERLQMRLDELNKELEAKKNELDAIHSREELTVVATLKEINAYEWYNDELERNLRRANGKVEELKRQLVAKDAEIETLSEHNEELLSRQMHAKEASSSAMRMSQVSAKFDQPTADKKRLMADAGSTPAGHHLLHMALPPSGDMPKNNYPCY